MLTNDLEIDLGTHCKASFFLIKMESTQLFPFAISLLAAWMGSAKWDSSDSPENEGHVEKEGGTWPLEQLF